MRGRVEFPCAAGRAHRSDDHTPSRERIAFRCLRGPVRARRSRAL